MAIRSNQAPSSPLAFDDLTTAQAIGPGKAYASQGRRDDAAGIPLSSLDRETSKLLPAKKRSHHVWVQGKLAPVRSVSIANLRGAAATATTPPPLPDNNPVLLVASPCVTERGPSPARSPGRFDRGVGASVDNNEKRRRSLDDGGAESDASENERIVTARDTQLRGYGIGGAGNIRATTDGRDPWAQPPLELPQRHERVPGAVHPRRRHPADHPARPVATTTEQQEQEQGRESEMIEIGL
ncbi:hypothetical protein S7711_10958 [Stachybotrys chartarum IBT 7711]|uniref:Uncharacterized protein n=1 Tax=Stachybotrys chartarum (strain CBS 109288 / IBT 7711) TaxID=1280523 RepID=A0A084BB08_STACB|nr:hypothetical protein S7711_10958 [Stachybotrys chartarum IBT 7711]